MIIEIWADDFGETDTPCSYLITTEDNLSSKLTLCPDARLIHKYEVINWNDAMTKAHELLGWEPYKPVEY